MIKKVSVLALAAMALAAQAADWSDTSVGYRYAPQQSEPGVSDKVSKNILNVTHVSGDSKGSNLFSIDLLRSNSKDPAANGPSGAQEWYGFYKRSFSMQGLSGAPVTLGGLAKDLNLNLRLDAGAKNTAFAPAPFKTRVGVSAAMPVSAGFWDLGLDAYNEKNHNGIVGKDVTFKTTWALTSAWAVPLGAGSFGGFFDIVGPKGKDGFGAQTKTETLVRASYMVDMGGPKSGWKAGLGVEHWNNKFGCDNGTTSGSSKNSCKATTPLLLVEYHL